MSTLKQQNTINIDSLNITASELASRYERKSFILLQVSWILWMLVTVIGIAIAIIELVSDNTNAYQITNACLALGISTIGMVQTKFKPHKKGYTYKSSASRIRKLGRTAQKLKWSKLNPDEIAGKLEDIYEEMDDIELEIYSENESDQGAMREGFGQGPKQMPGAISGNMVPSIRIDDLRNIENQEPAE